MVSVSMSSVAWFWKFPIWHYLGQKGLCSDSFKQQMALKTAWCTDGRHRKQDHHAAISLVGLGPDVATWLAHSSHSSWAGAGNQSGVHKPLFYEPNLATGFNRPDGTPAGETSLLFTCYCGYMNAQESKSSLGHSCFLLIVLSSPLS